MAHLGNTIVNGALRVLGDTSASGQIKTSFKNSIANGSFAASSTTVPDLCTELRYSSGATGSVSIGTAYTKDSVTIPTGWYNFMWIPHRSGGVNGSASGDNCDYGTLYLTAMNMTSSFFLVRFTSGSIAEVKNVLKDDNTDTKVTQTATTANAAYEVLFSETADNTTRTEGSKKAATLRFNPASAALMQGTATVASGFNSHAEGYQTTASGNQSHAEGHQTIASGDYSHAEGIAAQAIEDSSHAEGYCTTASGAGAHAEGGNYNDTTSYRGTLASGKSSHAEGTDTKATGNFSHAEGWSPCAVGIASHAEGEDTTALGECSHAEGSYTHTTGLASHAEGDSTIASGDGAHAEGNSTYASGDGAHAEGDSTTASGQSSHAEGYQTWTSPTANGAHAEGGYPASGTDGGTTANGFNAHAEGFKTVANGASAHAEGNYTTASSSGHAEGKYTQAGTGAHAEGGYTIASGEYAHAEGYCTTAMGKSSHASGQYTSAAGTAQTVIGKYNVADTESLFIIGNGTGNTLRSNALKIDSSGNFYTNRLMLVGKESSRSTSTVGTWTAMCRSDQAGSPTLPIANTWFNVINLNNWTDTSTNWVSQLAIATQDNPQSGVWYRHNNSGGTDISSSTWYRLADGENNGLPKFYINKIAAGTTAWDEIISFSKLKSNHPYLTFYAGSDLNFLMINPCEKTITISLYLNNNDGRLADSEKGFAKDRLTIFELQNTGIFKYFSFNKPYLLYAMFTGNQSVTNSSYTTAMEVPYFYSNFNGYGVTADFQNGVYGSSAIINNRVNVINCYAKFQFI